MRLSNSEVASAVSLAASVTANPKISGLIDRKRTGNEKEALGMDFNELSRELRPLLPKALISLQPTSPTDINEIAAALSAAIKGVGSSIGEMVCSLFIIRSIEVHAEGLFEEIFPRLGISAEAMSVCHRVIGRFGITLETKQQTPPHEVKLVESFRNAVRERRYEGISSFLDALAHAPGLQHPILSYLICLSTRDDMAGVVKHLSAQVETDFVSVHFVLDSLTFPLLMQIGILTPDFLIKIHVVKLASRSGGRHEKRVDPNALADVIKTVQSDKDGWHQFCSYFGRYPPHYPSLWIPLGKSLEKASSEVIEGAIKRFSAGLQAPFCTEFDAILAGLSACGGLPSHSVKTMMKATLRVWRSTFRSRRQALPDGPSQEEPTSFYNVVVNALGSILTLSQLKRRIRRILAFLDSSQNHWFDSSTDYRAHMVIAASYLTAYLAAYHDAKTGPDPVFEAFARERIQRNFEFACFGIWTDAPAYVTKAMLLL